MGNVGLTTIFVDFDRARRPIRLNSEPCDTNRQIGASALANPAALGHMNGARCVGFDDAQSETWPRG